MSQQKVSSGLPRSAAEKAKGRYDIVKQAHLFDAVLRADQSGQGCVLADGCGGNGEGVVDLAHQGDQVCGPAI